MVIAAAVVALGDVKGETDSGGGSSGSGGGWAGAVYCDFQAVLIPSDF